MADAKTQVDIAKLQADLQWLKQELEDQEKECLKRDAQQCKEIDELKEWKKYCDRLALKWGNTLMVVTIIAAAITMGADKLKEKILSTIFP